MDYDVTGVIACYDCGLAYGGPGWVEAVIPDAVWSHIGPDDGDGILCINCMARRLARKGFEGVPVKLTAGPLVAATGGAP